MLIQLERDWIIKWIDSLISKKQVQYELFPLEFDVNSTGERLNALILYTEKASSTSSVVHKKALSQELNCIRIHYNTTQTKINLW